MWRSRMALSSTPRRVGPRRSETPERSVRHCAVGRSRGCSRRRRARTSATVGTMSITPGETTWVQGGPFVGMEGRVVQVDPDGTALEDLEIFGRSTRAELDVTLLGF